MHLTARVLSDVGSLRTDAFRAELRRVLAGANLRGVSTFAVAVLDTHVHLIVKTRSRQALADATRYVYSQLAAWLNRRDGRSGQVFVERFWSTCARSVRQAWQVVGYVLANPRAAGFLPWKKDGVDPNVMVNRPAIAADRFLRSVLGPTEVMQAEVMTRMLAGTVPFVPLRERMQPMLPGF